MVLSDNELATLIQSTQGTEHPFLSAIINAELQLQPAGVDLTLGTKFKTLPPPTDGSPSTIIDVRTGLPDSAYHTWDAEELVVYPGTFYLATTAETVGIPKDKLGYLAGRSTLARYGVFIHASSPIVEPGFAGAITLEIVHAGTHPVLIPAGHRVAQLLILELSSEARRAYDDERSKYNKQATTQVAKPDHRT